LRDDSIRFCEDVRALRPDIVFGADIIAGFPDRDRGDVRKGTRQSVLVERSGLSGHAENFAPVRFATPQTPSAILHATITGLENGALIAQEAQ
jgi:tRNA A37 methylthiotransferase MiaB